MAMKRRVKKSHAHLFAWGLSILSLFAGTVVSEAATYYVAPIGNDAAELDRFISRLAADGLWIHEALSSRPLPEQLRKRIAARLVAMAAGPVEAEENLPK